MDAVATKNFYTLEEFRTGVLGNSISKAHLYNLVKRGEIPSISFGRRLLISAVYVKTLTGK